jgi:hypothetical protein
VNSGASQWDAMQYRPGAPHDAQTAITDDRERIEEDVLQPSSRMIRATIR